MNYLVAAVVLLLAAVSCQADQVPEESNSIAVNQTEAVAENSQEIPDVKFLLDWLTHPQTEDDDLEARKKKHKKYILHVLAAAFLIKGAFLPIAIGFLKLLTGKALLITSMALMLIFVISLKKISSSGHSHRPQVINLVPHGHRRDIGSQEMAYRSWLDDDLLR